MERAKSSHHTGFALLSGLRKVASGRRRHATRTSLRGGAADAAFQRFVFLLGNAAHQPSKNGTGLPRRLRLLAMTVAGECWPGFWRRG